MRRMDMQNRLTAIAAVTLGLAAAAPSAPALAQYQFLTTIPIPPSPSNNVGGQFQSYDISFFDPTTQLDYVADRSNASVDIFSAKTNAFVGRLGGSGGVFTGLPIGAPTAVAGPDGVVVVPASGAQPSQLWAGNGNSTLVVFNLATGGTTGTQAAFSPIPTGPATANRVDELVYDPKSSLRLASSEAAS